MENNEYWEKRIAEKTWETYNSMEEKNRKLLELYHDASRKIREELYEIAEQLSENRTLSRTEMYRQQHLQKLEKKYRKILSELARKTEEFAKENMEQGIQEVYEQISVALDVPEFSLPDKELMRKLIEEPWRNGNFSERLWKNQKKLLKALKNVLVIGMQQGKNITDMAVELNIAMGKGFYAAHRLVRTETMHCLNQSCLQRYKDAEIKKVSFWAAKDERTCEICGAMHGKKYDIEKAPVLPVHPNCRCTYLPVVENNIAETSNSDIMNLSKTKEAMEVHLVGKINRDIYKCITDDIVTDEVIITDNQMQHILDRHPDAYKEVIAYLSDIIREPDFIIQDKHENTGLVVKRIKTEKEYAQMVLRICTSKDDPNYKNSVISCWEISEKRLQNYLRNKTILYKKE
ncbi:MAG: minor capsid protein [Bacillota bacterium]|nr:minor capsid protein [Bacillota bacterium]